MAFHSAQVRLALAPLAFAVCALGQTPMTLDEACSRRELDWAPINANREIRVEGVVSHAPIRVIRYTQVPIQDDTLHGLVLESDGKILEKLQPGDVIRVSGVLAVRAGLPVLHPEQLNILSRVPPPKPLRLNVPDLTRFRYLGVLVETEAYVTGTGQNAGGQMIMLGDSAALSVFLPGSSRNDTPQFETIRKGDRVRVRGIASQYSGLPPYNRYFQLLIGDPDAVTVIEKGWVISPSTLLTAILSVLVASGVWFLRVRRMAAIRRTMRSLNSLGEELIGSRSPEDILTRLTRELPVILQVNGVRLYLFNKVAKTLEKVPTSNDPDVISIPAEDKMSGVAQCCRNRKLQRISEAARVPAPGEAPVAARKLDLVPMFAHDELFGVLELRHRRHAPAFQQDEQSAVQHLANQVAAALKLLEHQTLQEQLFRSEKLAAAGQLISGVANELRGPLAVISQTASGLAMRGFDAEERSSILSIAEESHRASEVVARLTSFSWGKAEARPVDLNCLLEDLAAARQHEWDRRGIEPRITLLPGPVTIIGAREQLEQVFANLLMRAEHRLQGREERWLAISTRVLARRVLVEMTVPAPLEGNDDTGVALGMEVCRGIVQSHGGELRATSVSKSASRLEAEFPMPEQRQLARSPQHTLPPERSMTLLLVEPDSAHQRHLLMILSASGHRVVPVSTAEEALDLSQRLRFDVVFSAARLPGINWIEMFERIRGTVAAVVLIVDAMDPALANYFGAGEGYVLQRPVDQGEARALLAEVMSRGRKEGKGSAVQA